MKPKSDSTQVRVPMARRIREWSELTGQSESKIASVFLLAGFRIAEGADEPIYVREQVKRELSAMAEAQKLRRQAATLNKRAVQVVREARGVAK